MRAIDVIRKKRNREALTREELAFMCNGTADKSIPDYQVSAFLMAAYLNGMTEQETADLTMCMAESGEQIDLSGITGVKVDKHSTGGVGDTTTLVLAPLVAACGGQVAKMSGRGLGHTGGTLDKLESIPGLSTSLTREQFLDQVKRIGIAVISQTPTLVPADSKFYALRDVTATVDSIPLIASSVMSKKIAAGAEAIVLDVKCGRGAFMQTHEDARKLAQAMVDIGRHLGRRVSAIITDMETPLGAYIGNALEVEEAVEILQGKHAGTPLWEVSLVLAGHLLALGGLALDPTEGRAKAEEALRSGAGLKKLREMIEAQGGDGRVTEDLGLLPKARVLVDVMAPREGWLAAVDALDIGEAANRLGAGRAKKEDSVDPAVGVVLKARAGQHLKAGDVLATLHVNDESRV
ncbi:MAG: thymidine phosphorylase, partial [Proteobacteria bacterium]|nr:thymidine phosphorylase [Pseudomonadota bacterium]